MQKKLLIAISCFTLTLNLAHASPYFGLSTGIIVNTSDEVGVSGDNVGNFRGMPVTLSVGYDFDLHGTFSLGGEAFFTPTTGKLNSSYGNYLTTTYGYGLSFIPGIQLSEHTLAYARLGWVGAHFEDQNSNANGGQFGLGLKTSVTQNWDVRVEYDITSYEIDNAWRDRWNPFRSSTSTVSSDQFIFGVVYRFI
jgi:opacity protein-like surface antigen